MNERDRSAREPGEAPNANEPPTQGEEVAADESDAPTKVASPASPLEEARSKANTYLDLAQRTQADFVNYKRRVEQERGEYARSARADIIVKLLPALDDLERAVASLPKELATSDWVQGIVHIERKLRLTFENLGVKRIEAVGKAFDPWQHEAVAHEPSQTVPAEAVTRIFRPGYTLEGRVIRPVQVLVSSGPPDGPESSGEQSG